MNVYLITGACEPLHQNQGTLAAAKDAIVEHLKVHPTDRDEIRVELIDVLVDKAAILRMLNYQGGYQNGEVLRTWRVGPRGGLVECPNGE